MAYVLQLIRNSFLLINATAGSRERLWWQYKHGKRTAASCNGLASAVMAQMYDRLCDQLDHTLGLLQQHCLLQCGRGSVCRIWCFSKYYKYSKCWSSFASGHVNSGLGPRGNCTSPYLPLENFSANSACCRRFSDGESHIMDASASWSYSRSWPV